LGRALLERRIWKNAESKTEDITKRKINFYNFAGLKFYQGKIISLPLEREEKPQESSN